jgi:hypothetical protein
MEYCAPMHYDDFISAVSLSLSCVDDKMSLAYCEELLNDFIIPLSQDINQRDYNGYKPHIDTRLLNSIKSYAYELPQMHRRRLFIIGDFIRLLEGYGVGTPIPPREPLLALLYIRTFSDVIAGNYFSPCLILEMLKRWTWHPMIREFQKFFITKEEYSEWIIFYVNLLNKHSPNVIEYINWSGMKRENAVMIVDKFPIREPR